MATLPLPMRSNPTGERAVREGFLHPQRDFSQWATLRHMSGFSVDISKGYFQKPIGSSNPLWSASKSLKLNEKIHPPELCRHFRRLRPQLRELATERANSSRFPRPLGAFSQNATLPVAFSVNDGAETLLVVVDFLKAQADAAGRRVLLVRFK